MKNIKLLFYSKKLDLYIVCNNIQKAKKYKHYVIFIKNN
ncbi:hypothetical protein CNEO3_870004 [Clostridium neonatale]|nr:hypothetical protein CNEO2_440033 [Clostridium neonatale]CAI3704164.1 hypothetical protein CNEO3_870004 [Clostridium neonatale]